MADRTDPLTATAPSTPAHVGRGRVLAALLVVATVGAATGFWAMKARAPISGGGDGGPLAGATTTAPVVGGVPLFSTWPKDQPEVVLVLTGQTFGYLSPCGCSHPQKGGLERRANFIDQLKRKGWPVIGLDLGDLSPHKGLPQQALLKYRTAMKAMGAMGYAAVGLGEEDFHQSLYTLLGEYSLQNPDKRPIVVAANLVSVQLKPDGTVDQVFPRAVAFPGAGKRSMVEAAEVIASKEHATVAVVGAIGPEVGEQIKKQDRQFSYAKLGDTIAEALKQADSNAVKPSLRVLLFAGNLDRAKEVAQRFPQFQVVVCQSDEPEPPQFPTVANGGKTLIVQVGQKGQNVGVVGAFRGKAELELKYQLVPMGEEYLTPEDPDPAKNAEIEKNHKVLQLLQEYAEDVRKQNLLAAARARPIQHAAQLRHQAEKLTYVGAQKCAQCHAAEYAVWSQSKHSHAYEALEKYAKRPSLRQYDPECASCHTTGFEYVGGFENETATAFLKGNQCENCHGPGSAHSALPNDKSFYPALLPWRAAAPAGSKLPSKAFLEEMAKKKPLERNSVDMPADQKQMVNAVSQVCMKCHDTENDPKFDFYEYFPKIYHSGLKSAGLPEGAK